MLELGMQVVNLDRAVFKYGGSILEGIIMVHVDDILYAGNKIFLDKIVNSFKNKFKISREETTAFKYLGVNIRNHNQYITLDQKEYVSSMQTELLPDDRLKPKSRLAEDCEKQVFKQGVGQLGWLTNMSRPEGAYMYCILSTIQSKPTMQDFILYKKAIRDLKSTDTNIRINKMNLDECVVSAFSDASFASLGNGASQLGHIIFLHDKEGNCVPLAWASRKARRVARSSLTAETLAAVEAIDAAEALKKLVEEILGINLPKLRLYVDNKSLFDSARTTNSLADKRLLIDLSAIREMIERDELDLKWVSSEDQLADVLTKAGASKQKLTAVISSGRLPLN